MDDELFKSPNIVLGWWALCSFLHIAVQRPNKFCKSLSSSATFLPSATVRTIIPKPCGVMLFTRRFNRSFSALFSIFCEIEILSEKGTKTIYLPAIESSELILGPLVDIGSLAICTNIDWFDFKTSLILPSLSISFSNGNLLRLKSFSLPVLTLFVNFKSEGSFGPKSW